MTTTLHDAAEKACQEIGVIYRQTPADSKFHYLDVCDKAARNGGGRIRIFPDGEGGQVWNHYTAEYRLFWARSDNCLTPEDIAVRRQRAAQERYLAEKELAREYAKAAELATVIWKAATPLKSNPYLHRKKVAPTNTLRQIALSTLVELIGYNPKARGEALAGVEILIVPVKGENGMTTIEMIDSAGRKAALAGGRKRGCFWATHRLPEGDGTGLTLGIGEGVATMLTYFMASTNIGIAALSCGNLKNVAEQFRRRYPMAEIVIISDIGHGETAACEAARATASFLAKPVFPECSAGSDINDLYGTSGLDAVRPCLATPRLNGATLPDNPPPLTDDDYHETGPSDEDVIPTGLGPIEPGPVESRPLTETEKLEQQTAELVAELNRTYFVSKEGGKTFVYHESWNEQLMRHVLERFSFPDFRNYFLNQEVYAGVDRYGKPVSRSLGEVWLKHKDRRQYDGITMEPGKETPGFYNLWQGFSVEPLEGIWQRMQDHIHTVICSRDYEAYKYVIGWLATAVQHPGEQAEVALCLRGKRGTGKGMLGNYLCKLFGTNAAHITSSKHMTGNFNSHLRDVVFLFADEAFWAGDKAGESVLKGLITEPTLPIEGKGRDIVFVKNMLHILMASNNDWVVPAGLEERRFCVLEVSDERMQDKAYFAALAEEMDNGGLAAMLYDLQNYDLSDFRIRAVPQTNALYEQKLQSLDDFQDWWFHRLSEGELVPGEGWEMLPSAQLYEAYIANLAARAITRRSGETMFGKALRKVLPAGWPKKVSRQVAAGDSRQVNHYQFPDLELCRQHFATMINYRVDWEADT